MIRISLADPEIRKVWEAALNARREVASWPAWKRGEAMSSGKPRPKISRPTAKGMGVPKRTPAGFVCSEDDIGPPPLERHGRDLDAAWADGAKSERDEVVVWLRGMAIDRTDSAAEHLLAIALEIEQGKHHIPF